MSVRKHSPLELELQQLLNQVQVQETRLHSLNAEIQVVQRKLNDLRAEKEAQTKQLLAEQATQLTVARLALTDDLDALNIQLDELKTEKSDVLKQIDIEGVALKEVEAQVAAKTSELKSLTVAYDSAYAELEELKLTLTGESQALADLYQTKSELENLKNSYEAEIEDLKPKEALLGSRINSLEAEFALKKAAQEEEITKLNHILVNKKTEAMKIEKQATIERKELATRKIALDEREKNIRLREYKVNQDEDTIRENANLLEL